MRFAYGPALMLLLLPQIADAGVFRIGVQRRLQQLNAELKGRVVDYTHNHGSDRRICSPALGQKRSMYVYLPPGFDPKQKYPGMIWLHGFGQDEMWFLELTKSIDQEMLAGNFPLMVIVAPDGSVKGKPSLFNTGSFYFNSDAGRFGDYITDDVWNFLVANYPIRPEPEAHVIAGGSMGGFGAYNIAIKHPERFRVVAGIMPPLNLRYENCKGDNLADYNPDCERLIDKMRPYRTVAWYYGVIRISARRLLDPLFNRSEDATERLAAENPMEMLTAYDVKPGQHRMFIGYVGKDEFNIDAQVESFLNTARKRGLAIAVVKDLTGHHNNQSGLKFLCPLAEWLKLQLAGYPPTEFGERAQPAVCCR